MSRNILEIILYFSSKLSLHIVSLVECFNNWQRDINQSWVYKCIVVSRQHHHRHLHAIVAVDHGFINTSTLNSFFSLHCRVWERIYRAGFCIYVQDDDDEDANCSFLYTLHNIDFKRLQMTMRWRKEGKNLHNSEVIS